jgi:hypothetical protein
MLEKLTEPIRLGLALTVGFVLFVLALIFPKLSEVSNLKLNELGDFLGGISSTLAFIWIIIAVLLQRDELRAQREELRQSREALALQAAELKRTADQQALQVEIMGVQLETAKAEREFRVAFDYVKQLSGDIVSLVDQLTRQAGEIRYPHGATAIFRYSMDSINGSYAANSFKSALQAIQDQIRNDAKRLVGGGSASSGVVQQINRLAQICTQALLSKDNLELLARYDPALDGVIRRIGENANEMTLKIGVN